MSNLRQLLLSDIPVNVQTGLIMARGMFKDNQVIDVLADMHKKCKRTIEYTYTDKNGVQRTGKRKPFLFHKVIVFSAWYEASAFGHYHSLNLIVQQWWGGSRQWAGKGSHVFLAHPGRKRIIPWIEFDHIPILNNTEMDETIVLESLLENINNYVQHLNDQVGS